MKKPVPFLVATVLILAAAVYFIFFAPEREVVEVTTYYKPGEYIVTNVMDSPRLLKIVPVLEINGDHGDYLKTHEHIIRDTIIFLVRYKSETELRSPNIELTIRDEIIRRLDDTMGIDFVTNVYFYDFVLQ